MIDAQEPTDLEYAIMDRGQILGWPEIGPLTSEQASRWDSYIEYQEESMREHEAQEAAGGRTICPRCGERSVKTRFVYTLGYAGHPGAEQSALEECENCDYKDLA